MTERLYCIYNDINSMIGGEILRIVISSTSDLSMYEQIKNQIKDAILNNEIKDGDMLPSIRHLATELRVSVITTNRAYEELEKEGLISSVQGKGYFVTLNLERVEEECKFKIEQLILQAIDHCKVAKISKDSFKEIVDFLVEKELP